MNPEKIYPRTNDHETVYLKSVVKNPNIIVGNFTMYNDSVNDPRQFEKNNVLYHYPINHDRLVIGKFCSIACGAKFLFTSANHTQASLSTYPFPIFFEEWGLDVQNITSAWDNKGDIIKIPRRAAVGDIAARRWSFTDAACPLRALRWAPIWVRRCAAALSYGEIRFSRLPFLPASQNSILRKRRISAIITETDVRIGGRCRGRSAARTECRPA